MSEANHDVSRRTALAMIGAGFVAPAAVTPALAADSSDAAAVAKAVEDLRAAMLAGDAKKMSSLLSDHLSYGHSDAHLENKAAFIKNLDGPNAPGKFKSLALSNQTVDVVGNNAVVRHVFDGVNIAPDGTTSNSHIFVLQVWRKEKAAWHLLARQSVPRKA
jgi:ketosteroid isomerase-like protein